MKLPLSWLSEYIKTDFTPKKFADEMTMSGSKVENYEYLGQDISNVVVGKIMSISKHPNADKLVVCDVNVGDKTVQIVTGAKNLKTEDLIPVALDGAILPNDVTISAADMRGVKSDGMLCSFHELGLTQNDVPYADENGILVLNEDVPLGTDIRSVLGFDDYVFDFEITSNRPDCLSIIGLARESAATFRQTFKLRQPEVKGSGGDIYDFLSVDVAPGDIDLCPRYTARVVKNVNIGPSPAWLRHTLRACGVRPINNIVDITNYVMLEYGQPMHAFDYSCIDGKHITVRRAKIGEKISTLDGQNRILDQDMLLITDNVKPIGIAGVMGGQNSEITENTKTVVFESATFNGPSIRKTGKKLSLRTEASSRFEKGLDTENTLPAVERACELVEMLNAGDVVDGIIDVRSEEYVPRVLPLEKDKINRLLGTDIDFDQMAQILTSLEFKVDGENVIVPSWRADVEGMADLAEEVARIYGYNNIPSTLLSGEATQGALTDRQMLVRDISYACRAAGFDEAITYSFINPAFYDRIEMPEDSPLRLSTKILNPLGEEVSIMRTTTLPSMLETVARNYNRRNASVRLFELGKIYLPKVENGRVNADVLPDEKSILTFAAYGDMDFYSFKGAVCAALSSICRGLNISFKAVSDNASYHPGRCAALSCGDIAVGILGEIHPKVLKNYGINMPVLAAEISFDALFEMCGKAVVYTPLPKFPAVTRDIAIIIDEDVPVADIENIIRTSVGSILEKVELFDVYRGSQIEPGKKSVAYAISMRAANKTLTDTEADSAISSVLLNLESAFGASLRS